MCDNIDNGIINHTGNEDKKYWWQGPNSPFSAGAAQGHGVSSGASQGYAAPAAPAPVAPVPARQPTAVVGCSGNGCGSFATVTVSKQPGQQPVQAAAASVSNSISSTGELYWQQPGHPCSNHQGPDCPDAFLCVNYRSCVNGVLSPSNALTSQKPSFAEV